jgi:hypothetical protein
MGAASRGPWPYLWASPGSLIGLSIAALALLSDGGAALVDGVLESHGGIAGWLLRHAVPVRGGVDAIALGHVVIGRDLPGLDRTRRHERVHVAQYERWGPLFIPAYLACSAWAWVRGRDPYRDNRFEREAFRS